MIITDQCRFNDGAARRHGAARRLLLPGLASGLVLGALLAAPGVAMAAGIDPSFAGIWEQRGYGTIMEITATRVRTYDVTDVSCVFTDDLTMEDAGEAYDRVVRISNSVFTLHDAGDSTRYEFRAVRAMPERCRHAPKPDEAKERVRDPQTNFWTLWHAFRENYAFFDLRGVDWDAAYEQFRPAITSSTTPEQLFETLSDMLALLNDGHVELSWPEEDDDDDHEDFTSGTEGEIYELWKRLYGDDEEERFEAEVRNHVVQYVLKGQVKTAAEGQLMWGWAAPGVGYLNIQEMEFPEEKEDVELPQQLLAYEQGMAQVMRDLASARALIVDVRFNGGGSDAIALKIAGSFTRQERLAFSKKAVEGESYTPTQQVRFGPSGSVQFTKPVYLLQSGTTMSAAEAFTLAMSTVPSVVSLGTTTYGALSDKLEKHLPNGWTTGVSNEIYVSANGRIYEKLGIPPRAAVPPTSTNNFHGRLRGDIIVALQLAGVVR